PAAETAQPHGEQSGAADAGVLADVAIERLSRLQSPEAWRRLVRQPHGSARQRPELAEDRRLFDEGETHRHEGRVLEQVAPEDLLLIVLGVLLQARIVGRSA